MSHSYDCLYQVEDKWEKLIIYLYSRILSGGAEISIGTDWSKIIHSSNRVLLVDLWGDTEGYESLRLRHEDNQVTISNRSWFSHKCFTDLLRHVIKKYSNATKKSIGSGLVEYIDFSDKKQDVVNTELPAVTLSKQSAIELIDKSFFVSWPSSACGSLISDIEISVRNNRFKPLITKHFYWGGRIEKLLAQRCIIALYRTLMEERYDTSC